MNATELRIGNLVNRKNKNTDKEEIIYLTASDILDISSNGVKSSFIYTPILLTEDLAIKCGFVLEDCQLHLDIDRPWINLLIESDNSFTIYSSKNSLERGEDCCGGYIEHVHTLQNLYFALANKELTINL